MTSDDVIVSKRIKLTEVEKELFQLIETQSENGIRSQLDVHSIKEFFKRQSLSSPSLFNVNCFDEYGFTALMGIAWDWYGLQDVTLSDDIERVVLEVITILLENGADINIQDNTGNTALHFACRAGTSSNIIPLLLGHGADPNIHDIENDTAITYASRCSESYNTMKALLEFGGIDVSVKNINGTTLIHEVLDNRLHRKGVTCGIKLLLDYGTGVSVNDQNRKGMTPLIRIANADLRNHDNVALELIQMLLNAKADSNIQFTRSIFPWQELGTIVSGDTALHIAVRNDWKIKLVPMLLDCDHCHPNLTIRNRDNHTALDIAKQRKSSVIIELIEKEHRHQIYKSLLSQWVLSTKDTKMK